MAAAVLPVTHVNQRTDGACLAACAAMVLTYLGLTPSYEQLLKVLDIRWFGAPFFNIRQLEQLGVSVAYQQGALADLQGHLAAGRPLIVPVATSELPYSEEQTNHALVVVGMDENYVYVNDPAFRVAPIPVPPGDFELAWLERDEYYAVLALRE